MGVRTRGLDIKAGAIRNAADKAARAEAEVVIQRWNEQLALGRDMLWSPTIRAALLAGTPWLDVFCPGCGTGKAIDLRADAEADRAVCTSAGHASGRDGALKPIKCLSLPSSRFRIRPARSWLANS